MKIVFMLTSVFLFTIGVVLANGVGNEIKKEVDGFYFEFGIDPKEPIANEKATMSISIHNSSTNESLAIKNLWIRISNGDEILFAASDFSIKAESPLFFVYTFKENGDYTIDFSAEYNSKDMKADFAVNIKKDYKKLFWSLIVLITAFVFGYISANIRKRHKF